MKLDTDFSMTFRGEQVRVQPVLIATISIWEATAITSRGMIPTVTDTVMKLPRPLRAIVVGLTAGWLTFHFRLVERALE